MNQADQLLDSVLRREIEFQQTATWLLLALARDLKELQSRIIGIFATSGGTSELDSNRSDALLLIVAEAIQEAYKEIRRRLEAWADDLIDTAEEDERERTKIAFGWSMPFAADFTEASLLIQGLSLKDSIQRNADALEFKFQTELAIGSLTGDTPTEVLRRVLGIDQFETSAFDLTLNGLETLARTAATTIPAQVKIAQQEASQAQGGASGASARIFWIWLAILDMRVCKICRARHEKQWDEEFKPIGHSLAWMGGPPIHYMCRCSIISLPVGAPAPGEVGFVEWINRQPPEELARIFGGELAKDVQSGKISQAEISRGAGVARDPKEL